MKAFVLAGGFGTRLREVVHGRPKVLATINGRPFLEYVIRYLKRHGVKEVVLGVGYLANYVREAFGDGRSLGVKIQYSEEDRPLGTAGAIKKAAKFFQSDFLVLNGDTYIDVDLNKLQAFHLEKKADVTIVTTEAYYGRGGVIETDKDGKVVRFEEDPQKTIKKKAYSNAGVYVFNPKILCLLKDEERSFLERDLFPALLKKDYRVFCYKTKGDYIDIGSPQRYKEAQKVFADHGDC